MRKIFNEAQLKSGSYRAFIYEPGSVVIIPLIENLEEMYLTSRELFATKAYNELNNYNISFDHFGGSKTISMLVSSGCEEVIV